MSEATETKLHTIMLTYSGDTVVVQFPFVAGETVDAAFATHLQPLLQELGLDDFSEATFFDCVREKKVKQGDLLSFMRPDEEGRAKIRVGLPAGCVNNAIAKLLEKQANNAVTRGEFFERMTALITTKIKAEIIAEIIADLKAEIIKNVIANLKAEYQAAGAEQWG